MKFKLRFHKHEPQNIQPNTHVFWLYYVGRTIFHVVVLESGQIVLGPVDRIGFLEIVQRA